jgi:hypothetical protein
LESSRRIERSGYSSSELECQRLSRNAWQFVR